MLLLNSIDFDGWPTGDVFYKFGFCVSLASVLCSRLLKRWAIFFLIDGVALAAVTFFSKRLRRRDVHRLTHAIDRKK